MTKRAADFEAMCAQHGVDPASIPDRPAHKTALGRIAGAVAGDVATLRKRKKAPPDVAKRKEKRRMLGTSGVLPPELRAEYTEGEQAVLAAIAREIGKRGGYCALYIKQIMKRSGARERLVQYTLAKAKRLGHLVVMPRPQRGGKHLSNVVKMLSRAWRDWISRRPKSRGETGCTNVHTPEKDKYPQSEKPQSSTPVERSQAGFQGETEATGGRRRRR